MPSDKLDYNQLKQRLTQITNPNHKTLLMTIYSCGARVGEITGHRFHELPPLKKSNFQITPTHLYITVLREKILKETKIILLRQKEPWLTEPIITHLNNTNKEEPFKMSTRNAQKIFRKYFPDLNPPTQYKNYIKQGIHLLRKFRATHMKQGHTIKEKEKCPDKFICLQLGWKDTRMLETIYDLTDTEDYKYLYEN